MVSARAGARLGFKFGGVAVGFRRERALYRQSRDPFREAKLLGSPSYRGVKPLQPIWQGRAVSCGLKPSGDGVMHQCSPPYQLVKGSGVVLRPGHPEVNLPQDLQIVRGRSWARRSPALSNFQRISALATAGMMPSNHYPAAPAPSRQGGPAPSQYPYHNLNPRVGDIRVGRSN